MRRIARNALILAGLVGAAVAIRGYLARETSGGEGEAQISYDDGSMNTIKPPQSEEILDIAHRLLESSV